MDASKYLFNRDCLAKGLGVKKFNEVVTDITATLRRHNLDATPDTAQDVLRYVLETIHLEKYDFKNMVRKELETQPTYEVQIVPKSILPDVD